jgi:hypothetical protein
MSASGRRQKRLKSGGEAVFNDEMTIEGGG